MNYNSQNPQEEEQKQPSIPRKRYLNPDAIALPDGFKIEVFVEGLTTPINIVFDETGQMYVADAGVSDGNGKVLKLTRNGFEVFAQGFNPPLTGINIYQANIYVSHRGYITVVHPDGTKSNIISGLPSLGDHHNNRVMFGTDGKMYFGQGTATNSGVVGEDNREWVEKYPHFHDYPGQNIRLTGQNFTTPNFLTSSPIDTAVTGAYSSFGETTYPNETIKGTVRASGSILRANPDGSNLEMVAWGLRNPFRLAFDRHNRLFTTNHGIDVRGSRPIENSPDEFHQVRAGTWYGWPDYTGGMPVTLPMFKPQGHPQPKFLLAEHPMHPPKPFASFKDHSAIMGFDFNYSPMFGATGDVFIAEYGSEAPETTGGKPEYAVGHRVSIIEMRSGKIYPFAINKSGLPAALTNSGGFDRPIDAVFGPDGALYVADFTEYAKGEPDQFSPGTGVIWRIMRA